MTAWPIAALGDVATVSRKGVDPAALAPATQYVGLEHIPTGGGQVQKSTLGDHDVTSTKFAFDHRHVLFGKLRPNLGKVARPGYAGVCSTDILPILPGRRLDAGFLAWFLRRPETTAWAAARATGANLPRLSPSELGKLPIPVPPMDEQRRIAAILDEADGVRAACRRQLRTAGDLGAAIFEDMFGDLLVTGGAWRSGYVSDLVESFASGKNVVSGSGDSGDDHFRVLRTSAITTGVFRRDDTKPVPTGYQPPDSHLVREGDLLFGRANTAALVGATAFAVGVRPGTLLPDKIWRFVWPPGGHVEPRFVDQLFRSRSFRRELSRRSSGTSGSMKNVSQAKVMSIPIGIPPFSLQRRFAEMAERGSQAVTAISLQYEESMELVAALQDRAFKGDL